MLGDLHCHTRLSDGTMSIDDLVFYAKRAGLSFLSVTDHDTMDGVTRASVLGKRYGVRVIPGVEISCKDTKRQMEVHLLCYLPDKPDRLLGTLNKILESRLTAGKVMISKVMRLFPVTEEHIGRICAGSKAIYPVHIMQALMDLGYCGHSHGSLFRYLFDREKGLCYTPVKLPGIHEVLEIVHEAGGLAVLAHPAHSGAIDLLGELLEQKLLHGIEAHHPAQDGQACQALADLARREGVLVTGGSDFHGFFSPQPQPLATCAVRGKDIDAIFRMKKQRANA